MNAIHATLQPSVDGSVHLPLPPELIGVDTEVSSRSVLAPSSSSLSISASQLFSFSASTSHASRRQQSLYQNGVKRVKNLNSQGKKTH
jgi:hypothetical protein